MFKHVPPFRICRLPFCSLTAHACNIRPCGLGVSPCASIVAGSIPVLRTFHSTLHTRTMLWTRVIPAWPSAFHRGMRTHCMDVERRQDDTRAFRGKVDSVRTHFQAEQWRKTYEFNIEYDERRYCHEWSALIRRTSPEIFILLLT